MVFYFNEFFILDFSPSKYFQPVDSKKNNAKRTTHFSKTVSVGVMKNNDRSFL